MLRGQVSHKYLLFLVTPSLGGVVGLGSNAFIQVFEEEEKDMKYAFCSMVLQVTRNVVGSGWVGRTRR